MSDVAQWIDTLKFDDKGLLTAVIQDVDTKEVLMVAFMNKEAVEKTVETGKAHFYSRSRQKLWLKGESSGHVQFVKQIFTDCDGDALLVLASQEGGACHEGYRTCFFKTLDSNQEWIVQGVRVFDPNDVYKSE